MQKSLFDRGTLRGLTIHHYWAWAIVAGYKPCENRSWKTKYRGPLAIHAGKSQASLAASREFCLKMGLQPPAEDELAFGAIVGVVDLVDVVDRETATLRYMCGYWATGEWCWILRNPRILDKPIPYRGGQQLFHVPNKLLALS